MGGVSSWAIYGNRRPSCVPTDVTYAQADNPEDTVEGGTIAFVSVQCFQMLRTVAELMINWQPNGSILIGHQLTVVRSINTSSRGSAVVQSR